jgi:hypothetical protein
MAPTNQVTAPLATHVTPPYLVTDFGKTAIFNCSIDGFPVLNVFWLKELQKSAVACLLLFL